MEAATLSLDGGFADPGFGAQSTFRAMIDAMARPGTLVEIGENHFLADRQAVRYLGVCGADRTGCHSLCDGRTILQDIDSLDGANRMDGGTGHGNDVVDARSDDLDRGCGP